MNEEFDEMGTHLDEDYINMELISSPPTKSQEFEFQNFSTSNHIPADHLFKKGTLLPLHLLHAASTTDPFLACSTAPCTNSNTPLDSCNISPSQSCRASCELSPTELTTFFNNQPRNSSWSKKLKMKLTKHSILAQKLKSSRSYLKSLFTKSACPDESSADNNYINIAKKLATLIKKSPIDDHRRSFSSNSAFTSFNPMGLHELQFSSRSSSAAELEVSIDAAIAHCKKSMQSFGIRSLPSPKYVRSN